MKIKVEFTTSKWEDGSGWQYHEKLECNIEDFNVNSIDELIKLYPSESIIDDILLDNQDIYDFLDESVRYCDNDEIIEFYSNKDTDILYALKFYDENECELLRYERWENDFIVKHFENCFTMSLIEYNIYIKSQKRE